SRHGSLVEPDLLHSELIPDLPDVVPRPPSSPDVGPPKGLPQPDPRLRSGSPPQLDHPADLLHVPEQLRLRLPGGGPPGQEDRIRSVGEGPGHQVPPQVL